MANESAQQGLRGTGSYSPAQRPTSFGRGMKLLGSRVSRTETKKHLKTLKRKKKGKKKEKY